MAVVDGVSSKVIYILCSVPQGSVLGPVLFILCMVDLADVAAERDMSLTRMPTTTESHPEMVGDMSCVTLNFDLSKIPFVRF